MAEKSKAVIDVEVNGLEKLRELVDPIPRRKKVWETLGGRKFVGYQETLVFLIGIGLFVKDYRVAGILVAGALVAYLFYAVANVVKAKVNIGGTVIEMGGEDPSVPPESHE